MENSFFRNAKRYVTRRTALKSSATSLVVPVMATAAVSVALSGCAPGLEYVYLNDAFLIELAPKPSQDTGAIGTIEFKQPIIVPAKTKFILFRLDSNDHLFKFGDDAPVISWGGDFEKVVKPVLSNGRWFVVENKGKPNDELSFIVKTKSKDSKILGDGDCGGGGSIIIQ